MKRQTLLNHSYSNVPRRDISAPAADKTHFPDDNRLFKSSRFRDMKGSGKHRPFSRLKALSRGAGMQRSVRDGENLHNFHALLDVACEIPAPRHFERPSAALRGNGWEASEKGLS